MKKSTLTGLVLVVMLGVVTSVFGQSLTLSTMAKSGYLSSCGSLISDDPVLQSDAWLAFDNGIWVDVWNSEGLTSKLNSGYDDEIDVGAGWAGKLGRVSVDTGVYYWNCYSIKSWNKDDIAQFYLELAPAKSTELTAFSLKQTVTPYVRMETMRDMGNGDVVNFESTFYAGAKHTIAFSDRLGVNGKLSLVQDSGVFGAEPGLLVVYEGQLNFSVTKTFTVTPLWVKYTDKFTEGEDHGVFGAGLSKTF